MRIAFRLLIVSMVLSTSTSSVFSEPDYWDPRLDDICQLDLIDVASQVPAGQGYWRLAEARFENEVEAGGTHHIYVRCQDATGNFIIDQKFFTTWPYGNTTVDESECVGANWACALTKGPGIDDYYGNYAMFGGNCPQGNCGWPYTSFVSETTSPAGLIGLSDKVIGMGLHNPEGTPCNAHVSYRLTFRWTLAGPPPSPEIARSPSSFSRTATQGENLTNNVFEVWNASGGTLEYTITDNAGWLSVSPGSGTSTGEHDDISIIYSVASLGLGSHNATVTISDPDATNTPQTIAVQVTVEPPTVPGDFDGDSDVDQGDFGRFQACLTGPGAEQNDANCAAARMDNDVDVDQDDYDLFALCMTGAGVVGNPDCTSGG